MHVLSVGLGKGDLFYEGPQNGIDLLETLLAGDVDFSKIPVELSVRLDTMKAGLARTGRWWGEYVCMVDAVCNRAMQQTITAEIEDGRENQNCGKYDQPDGTFGYGLDHRQAPNAA